MTKLFSFIILFLFSLALHAQDKIVLLSGKVINAKSVTINGYTIAYRTTGEKSKLRKVDPENVFSIQYADGSEKIIFIRDLTDTLEYTVEQMRMFIKGEQDAALYYKNIPNKVAGFAVGVGASFFSIYGLVLPPLYGTIVGAHSPNMEKMQVSDASLLNDYDYREGYKTKVRNRKVRNGVLSGFIGFAAGFVALAVIGNQ
jgi:tetrahydromethanopterin S-methyltransferase subunit F